MDRLLDLGRETDRERDRIDALDLERDREALRPRLRDGLLDLGFPSRPLDTERSPCVSPFVSIFSSLAFLPRAEDVMERGLGERPRDDMAVDLKDLNCLSVGQRGGNEY